MDNFEIIDKMRKVDKFDEFEKLEGNKLTVKEGVSDLGLDQKTHLIQTSNTYNIIQEEDFLEKTWDYMELLKEQEEVRMADGEKKMTDSPDYCHSYAKILAERYGGMSKKDRRKEFKKYHEVMDGKVGKLTEAYKKRKKKKKAMTLSEKLEYESQLIELNAEARDHLLIATQQNKERLEIKQAKNRMRKYYRLLRMYVYHMQDVGLKPKEKKKLREEYAKVKKQLSDEMKTYWKDGA